MSLLILIVFLTLYTLTLQRGVLTADRAEFQWVTINLDLAHPPGFPLYTLVTHTWLRLLRPLLPALEDPTLVSTFSIFSSSFTLVLLFGAVRTLTRSTLSGWLAVLALATSTTFWSQATTTNIRSLTGLFAMLAFYSLIRLEGSLADQPPDASATPPGRSQAATWLLVFTLALSSGLTHHLSLAFMGLSMGVWAVWRFPAFWHTPRLWLLVLAGTAVGLLPLIYLPLVAPELRSWPAFLDYALALGFRGDFFYFNTPTLLLQRLAIMWQVLRFQFTLPLLLSMLAGLGLLSWQKPRLGLLLWGTFLIHTLVTASYRAPQTVEYMLPAYLPLVLGLGWLVGCLVHLGPQGWLRWVGSGMVGLLLISAGGQGVDRWPSYRTLAQARPTFDYAQPIARYAPNDSLVLADWHWYMGVRLLLEEATELQRSDVDVRFVPPQSASYTADWAAAIEAGLAEGRPVITTHLAPELFGLAPYERPLGEGRLYANTPLPPHGIDRKIDVYGRRSPTYRAIFDNGVEAFGIVFPNHNLPGSEILYDVDSLEFREQFDFINTFQIGEEYVFEVAWRCAVPDTCNLDGLRTFAHLSSFEDGIIAQADTTISQIQPNVGYAQYRLTPDISNDESGMLPSHGLSVGLVDENGQPVFTERGTGLYITDGRLSNSAYEPFTQHPLFRPVSEEIDCYRRFYCSLRGYDWDHTLPDQTRLYLHWSHNGRYRTEVIDLPPNTPYTLPPAAGLWGWVTPNVLEPLPGEHYVPLGQGLVWTGSTPALDGLAPGESLRFSQQFHATRPVTRDIGVAVRLLGLEEDGQTWAWLSPEPDADVPAMGAIPTLKWVEGSAISHPRTLSAPPEAQPGQPVEGFLRLYDLFTQRPLPVLDSRLRERSPWIPFDQGSISNEQGSINNE